jgi:16S rRNA processing protein RimM
MPDFRELVLVGRVVKPQGRHGEVAVLCFSDREERFPTMRRVFAARPGGGEPRELRVERAWPHKGRFVLKFEGISSIDEAETLRELELRIPEEELAQLPEGSYYHHQLVGLRVFDEQGEPLGAVEELMETGAPAPVLVVRGAAGELMLPFADAFVRTVDLAAGRMVVVRPEYDGAD